MIFFSTKKIYVQSTNKSLPSYISRHRKPQLLADSVRINVHSDKFLRLARIAKIANISSSLKKFSPFRTKKNISFDNKYKKINGCHLVGGRANLSLLFLNQGLSSKEQNLLRCNLKLLGINLTQIPLHY